MHQKIPRVASCLPSGQIRQLQLKRARLLCLNIAMVTLLFFIFPTNPRPLLNTLYLGPEFELSGLRAREIITVPKGWLQTVGPVPLRVCGD